MILDKRTKVKHTIRIAKNIKMSPKRTVKCIKEAKKRKVRFVS